MQPRARLQADILLFLNNDVSVIHRSWLKEMILHVIRPGVGAVGARLLYPDGTVQHAGVDLGLVLSRAMSTRRPWQRPRVFLTTQARAGRFLCHGGLHGRPKAVFEKIGGFDEENFAVAFNDVDLCIRIREAGYRIIWTPYAELYHAESKSRGADLIPSQITRFHHEVEYLRRRWAKQSLRIPF